MALQSLSWQTMDVWNTTCGIVGLIMLDSCSQNTTKYPKYGIISEIIIFWDITQLPQNWFSKLIFISKLEPAIQKVLSCSAPSGQDKDSAGSSRCWRHICRYISVCSSSGVARHHHINLPEQITPAQIRVVPRPPTWTSLFQRGPALI